MEPSGRIKWLIPLFYFNKVWDNNLELGYLSKIWFIQNTIINSKP